jgi:hypothetical protein
VKRHTPEFPAGNDFPHTQQLNQNIVKWINSKLNTPEFEEFKRKQFEYTLVGPDTDGLDGFVLPPKAAEEHAVIAGFLGMCRAQRALAQCEHYFRRYPFRGNSISRDEHLQNVCQFYLSIFYMMKCRIKTTLNSLKVACPENRLKIGKFISAFEKQFDYEIRARNRVHHHEAFEDIEINRISITGMLYENQDCQSNFWRGQHMFTYRKFSREWALRARHRAGEMQLFVEVVALGLLTEAEFLRFPETS